MVKKAESARGVNAGKFKLNLPNTQELNQMSNVELDTILDQLKVQNMVVKGKMSSGLTPPGGNMREIRKTIARIHTIKRKRG